MQITKNSDTTVINHTDKSSGTQPLCIIMYTNPQLNILIRNGFASLNSNIDDLPMVMTSSTPAMTIINDNNSNKTNVSGRNGNNMNINEYQKYKGGT